MTKNGEFIYMRTRGRLEVDKASGVVTSFICTNTEVDEVEGKYLIKMMKKKYHVKTKKEGELLKLMDKEESDKKDLPVEDPRQLEKVILHLVTNLPSKSEGKGANKAIPGGSTSRPLAIIPPKKERIVSAIEKIYSVMTFPKGHRQQELLAITEEEVKLADDVSAPSTSQGSVKVTELSSSDGCSSLSGSELEKIPEIDDIYLQKQLEESMQMPTTSVCMEPLYTDFDLMTQPLEPAQYNVMTPLEIDDYYNGNFFYPAANQSAVEIKYQVLVAPEVMNNEIMVQSRREILELPSTSKSSLKRPNECVERNTIKNKISNISNDSDDESPDDDFSCLEALFDDEMLDKQIDSTINSFEQIFDPTFPEMLISNEVEEILQEIEDEQKSKVAGV